MMAGQVRQGPMAKAVAEALKGADVLPRDEGAVQLAKRYATLIDTAVPSLEYARSLKTVHDALRWNAATEGAFAKIESALAAHSVASDLGPKLLAVLTALGMTAAGRGAKSGTDAPRVPDELAALRKRAADRRAK